MFDILMLFDDTIYFQLFLYGYMYSTSSTIPGYIVGVLDSNKKIHETIYFETHRNFKIQFLKEEGSILKTN